MGLLSADNHTPRPSSQPDGGPDAPNLARPVTDLADPNPERRWEAALSARGEPTGVDAVLARLPVEPDLAVRQALFDALAATGGPVAARGLVDLLRSEDAHLRNEAIAALAELPDDVPDLIDTMLTADDPDVRIFTVNVLRDLRHPQTTAWLTRVIAEDTHPNVVGTALDHALELADPAMAPAALAARTRFADDPYVAFVCGLLLDRIEGSAS
ncbi:HEAT repeat domain-containing protein [Roseospira marina]|uniref:HEAT repeat domain-containing protein n=1 Tax=Roseospira marina TaxID=140057 RepID=A0A5M6I6G3_9PROT|nr:HEAT repeat domain-containing protein [Roseospira marina]KAA5603814.1 HEAT repeat domain-containing protein [Roseospira marina]MBB4316026.1 HEAT repeat protein [Roseospira marina]MBB5089192.1 HEAT repeat protein [Roseospira marina]